MIQVFKITHKKKVTIRTLYGVSGFFTLLLIIFFIKSNIPMAGFMFDNQCFPNSKVSK